ncbi:MAG: bifunctional ADP-dependent NAD(P)H-hydrate dehydratase/NAD(P)H-hydrate epimerase [Cellulomonadaceae bacterium]|jgi:hydroxyethylthiazole kinase-like uncharacterized protein yjeF|nr:bifunctional ADP-dependent NAD(P)H-hydrate dehydratase/NAD(P)H-hydrate epimerase [Cellulomonadaceae bacterium]
MLRSATVEQIRAAEQPLLDAGVPLMDQAARAVARAVQGDGFGAGSTVALLVGAGNNGGDALWAGKYLADAGLDVTAYLVADSVHGPGLAALRAAGGKVVVVGGAKAVPTPAEGGVPVAGAGAGGFGANTAGASISSTVEQNTSNPRASSPDDLISAPMAAANIADADVLIDGLLGIGATGAMRGAAADVIAEFDRMRALKRTHNQHASPWVVAVDCPSGIGVDGEGVGQIPGPALKADHTVTFGAPKPGLLIPPASSNVGNLTVENLGLDVAKTSDAPLPPNQGSAVGSIPGAPGRAQNVSAGVSRLTPKDVARLWQVPGPNDQKYSRGVVGVVAGTQRYPGAAILVTKAAANAGAGMVRYVGPPEVTKMVIQAQPEVVAGGGRVQAWVFGPGIPNKSSGDSDDGQLNQIQPALAGVIGTFAGISDAKVPAVIDAGALELVTKNLPPWVVLTPHAGELAALLTRLGQKTSRAEVEANPLKFTALAHQITGATVLLKGSTTVVVGQNQIYTQADAPYWLATAGAGDVLAGLLGTMLAQHAAAVVAEPGKAAQIAAAAAAVHGYAAALVNPGGPITASKVAKAIPKAVAQLLA